jgi:DNA adenine methylase
MTGPLSYIGGKNRIAKELISLFPKHTTYVEPFSGGAQVFFHKEPSPVEILNDLDGDIVNFFRVCQWHHEELIRYLRFCLMSRKLYAQLLATDPASLTDVQRAGRFFYLQKNCYGGLVLNRNYHYGVTKRPNYNVDRIPKIMQATHQRLRDVQIECLPYEEILERYDRPTTFFYLDPPYYNRKLYRFNFTHTDFSVLCERLSKLKGRFILSLNDVPEVRRLFSRFHIKRIALAYSTPKGSSRRYGEVIISNFVKRTAHQVAGTQHGNKAAATRV